MDPMAEGDLVSSTDLQLSTPHSGTPTHEESDERTAETSAPAAVAVSDVVMRSCDPLMNYFEDMTQIETNSFSSALETSSIINSVRRTLLMIPIVSYVKKSLPTNGKASEIEIRNLSRDLREAHRNQLLELEEYSRVIISPSSPREEEISEYRQEYGAAVEQISSQMKASDERRLEAALRMMSSLESDELKGGYARLLSLIETRVKCSDDAVELLKSRLSQSREEFISLRHSDALLEKTAQISYEKIRDTYTHLLRLSHRRATENDQQWIRLEARGREWMMNEMKSVLHGYRIDGSSGFESSDQSDRVNQHRLAASRRLQRFGERLISNSLRRTERVEITSEAAFRAKKLQAYSWRKKQAELMNDWLAMAERELEKRYVNSLQELSEKISEIRTQLHFLDLHSKKLSHLRHLSPRSYDNIRSQSFIARKASMRSSLPRGGSDTRKDSLEVIKTPPSVSMNLGTRLLGLSRAAGVESEEFLLLLTQLFHTLHPDPVLLQRVSHQVSHYETLLAKRRS